MPQIRPIKRAILSVYDKTGIIEFAQALSNRNVELIATDGTAQLLLSAGLSVLEVSDYTEWPAIMAGRVKTLHPKIHGGLLGRRGKDDLILAQHNIALIDLVVVNLYPFSQTVAKPACTLEDAIDNIDIGGLTMIRAAAKNYQDVAIVINIQDYPHIIEQMNNNNNSLTEILKLDLAIKAFEHTAAYDGMITNYLGKLISASDGDLKQPADKFPRTLNLNFMKKQDLRYGENSHQKAAFYIKEQIAEASVATAIQLQGKSMSYNNIADTDAALECVKSFSEPACVIVKHANPCGVAISTTDICTAYHNAFSTDPTAAFGGIIAFNRDLDHNTTIQIMQQQFVEVIIAPSINEAALSVLATKPNIRVLACGQWSSLMAGLNFKSVNGGLLVQERDLGIVTKADLRVVSKRQPNTQEIANALFSWKVAKFVKSNAIVYAKNNMTIGIGTEPMSRVNSVKMGILKAQQTNRDLVGCTMASDAFFPFRDGIDAAAKAGINCVIQPGGSIRDDEIIAAANEYKMVMIFTNMRHFRH